MTCHAESAGRGLDVVEDSFLLEDAFAGLGLGDAGEGCELKEGRKFEDKGALRRRLLVGDPEGRVRLVESAALTVDELKDELEALCGVPAAEQMLSSPSCDLLLLQGGALALDEYAMVYVRMRCMGGKGGFGAMLRGQASRPGMKKAESNTGAMRDLSGRRLRHVEQEAQVVYIFFLLDALYGVSRGHY